MFHKQYLLWILYLISFKTFFAMLGNSYPFCVKTEIKLILCSDGVYDAEDIINGVDCQFEI